MSQNDKVLHALQRGPITPRDAIDFGCYRLAARIKNLREQGHNIHTELCITADNKRFARYTLLKQSKAA